MGRPLRVAGLGQRDDGRDKLRRQSPRAEPEPDPGLLRDSELVRLPEAGGRKVMGHARLEHRADGPGPSTDRGGRAVPVRFRGHPRPLRFRADGILRRVGGGRWRLRPGPVDLR